MAKAEKAADVAGSDSGLSLKRSTRSASARAERRKDVHVVPSGGGWTVRKQGAVRATKHFPTQKEAVTWARHSAKSDSTDLVVHNRDGTIRSKDSYGTDPFPSRDRNH